MEQVKALCSTLPPRREQDSSKKFFQQVPSKRVGQRPGRGRASYAYRGCKQNWEQNPKNWTLYSLTCSPSTSAHIFTSSVPPQLLNAVQPTQSVIARMGIIPLGYPTENASRTAAISSEELGTVDEGQVGSWDGKSVPHKLSLGAKPNLEATPPQFNQSQALLVEQEVAELQGKGAVIEMLLEAGFYSTLFLVPKKDGWQRPVINLKSLNNHVCTPHFKMEGIHTLKTLLQPGDWLAKVDLKDAYFSILIHPNHGKYLSFQLGQNKAYQFICLPFGLTSAPWVFTKTLRPVAALVRELGMWVIFT